MIDYFYSFCAFIFVILLIFSLSKLYLNSNHYKNINNDYISILDKKIISRDSYIIIIKIGELSKILYVSGNNSIILHELNKEETHELNSYIKKSKNLYNNTSDIILNKFKRT